MNYLLDTDHASVLQLGVGPAYHRLASRIQAHSSDEFFLSIVTFHEQTLGGHGYINQAKNNQGLVRGYSILTQILNGFRDLPTLDFDAAAVLVYDSLLKQHRRVGRMDLRIAAIALSQQMTLLTANAADFGPIANLAIEDWIT